MKIEKSIEHIENDFLKKMYVNNELHSQFKRFIIIKRAKDNITI